jgi:hypothetical protein
MVQSGVIPPACVERENVVADGGPKAKSSTTHSAWKEIRVVDRTVTIM